MVHKKTFCTEEETERVRNESIPHLRIFPAHDEPRLRRVPPVLSILSILRSRATAEDGRSRATAPVLRSTATEGGEDGRSRATLASEAGFCGGQAAEDGGVLPSAGFEHAPGPARTASRLPWAIILPRRWRSGISANQRSSAVPKGHSFPPLKAGSRIRGRVARAGVARAGRLC